MKNKKLYSLHIYQRIDEDWVGTVWHSRLYATEKACKKGCLTDEFFEIVAEAGDRCYQGKESDRYAEEWENDFKAGFGPTIEFVNAVRYWLNGDKGKTFDEYIVTTHDANFFWDIVPFVLSPSCKP